jgi:hypothetical protein
MKKSTKAITFSTLVAILVVAFLAYKVFQDFKGIDPFEVDFDDEE